MERELAELLEKIKQEISAAQNEYELNNAKSRALGKKSILTEMMKRMGTLSPEERPLYGKVINDLKKKIESFVDNRSRELLQQQYQQTIEQEKVDLTLPGYIPDTGGLHPLTQI